MKNDRDIGFGSSLLHYTITPSEPSIFPKVRYRSATVAVVTFDISIKAGRNKFNGFDLTFPSLILLPISSLLFWMMSMRTSHSSMSFPSWREAFTWEPICSEEKMKIKSEGWGRRSGAGHPYGCAALSAASHHVDKWTGCHIHPSNVPVRKQTLKEDETCLSILSLRGLGTCDVQNECQAETRERISYINPHIALYSKLIVKCRLLQPLHHQANSRQLKPENIFQDSATIV